MDICLNLKIKNKKLGRHNRLIKTNMLRTNICDENNNSLKLQPNDVCLDMCCSACKRCITRTNKSWVVYGYGGKIEYCDYQMLFVFG